MKRTGFSIHTEEIISDFLSRYEAEGVRDYFMAMMHFVKVQERRWFDELIKDSEFISFAKSNLGVDIITHAFDENFVFKGVCKCGMRISRSINDPLSTREDGVRYFYTNQDENDGYNIFRCKQCEKLIDKRWSVAENISKRFLHVKAKQ